MSTNFRFCRLVVVDCGDSWLPSAISLIDSPAQYQVDELRKDNWGRLFDLSIAREVSHFSMRNTTDVLSVDSDDNYHYVCDDFKSPINPSVLLNIENASIKVYLSPDFYESLVIFNNSDDFELSLTVNNITHEIRPQEEKVISLK